MSVLTGGKVAFGLYEADLQTGELWKAGFRVKLQSQPFKVLAALIEHPGEIVTREDLQLRLWGRETTVDFDHSLGTAINKIRDALGDSADNPRFIETLSRRGYRFIAPVHHLPAESRPAEAPPASHEAPPVPTPPPVAAAQTAPLPAPVAPLPAPVASPVRWKPWLIGISALAIVSAVVASYFIGGSRTDTAPPHIVQVTHDGHLAPTISTMENLRASATDGVHLFTTTIRNGRFELAAIPLHFGTVDPLPVSDEIAGPTLGDISPDGSRLLVRSHLSPESEQPLWIVPTLGGSAQRIGAVLAHDATWMPDGNSILIAAGDALYLTPIQTAYPSFFAKLPGRAFWLRWQPGGNLLRFTIVDPIAHTTSLWQMSATDRKPVRILAHSGAIGAGCCGVWTADGRDFVFQSTQANSTDLWQLHGTSTDGPRRLTDGPLQFQSPVAAREGRTIYFLGMDARSELESIGPGGVRLPVTGLLAGAVRVDFSRDGKWVAWTDSRGALWRARVDGTDKLQLTTDTLDVFLAHWSPDATRIAFMAREPGKAWQIYIVDPQGGEPRPLLRESRNAADPSWSPDGQSIVFGRVNDMMGKEDAQRNLEILHLADSTLSEIPASAGLFSPRWSPDGRYIAALALDQRAVKLFNVATKEWTTLPVSSGADPIWSADSRSLFVHASMDPLQPILRITIPDLHVEQITRLAESRRNDSVDFVFVGLTADGSPLIRSRTYTGNIYSLDLK